MLNPHSAFLDPHFSRGVAVKILVSFRAYSQKEWFFCFLPFATYALWFTIEDMRHALCFSYRNGRGKRTRIANLMEEGSGIIER
jgi:hypothetical protein